MLNKIKKLVVENKETILKTGISVFKYRNEITSILKNVEWDEITKGQIVVKEEMLNNEIKSMLLSNLDAKTKDNKIDIKDINVEIEDGYIILSINAKYMFLDIKRQYKITINSFEFNKYGHKVELEYEESRNLFDNAAGLALLSKKIYLIFITVSFKLLFGMIEQTQINRGI